MVTCMYTNARMRITTRGNMIFDIIVLWPPSIKFDHGSTSWLSCLLDCCSVTCGCRDRCGRNNLCHKSRIILCVVSDLLQLMRPFLRALLPVNNNNNNSISIALFHVKHAQMR